MPKPRGVHLVGSVPGASEEEVFRKAMELLPGRLATVPDGETGSREYFTFWQAAVFPEEIHSMMHRKTPAAPGFQLEQKHIKPTKYDEAAIASYPSFVKLREAGVIPKGTRFQVCIPGVASAVFPQVDPQYRAQAYPLYLKQLLQDLQHLLEAIPVEDLAIQIDLAVEFGNIEHARGRFDEPYLGFGPCLEGDAFDQVIEWTTPIAKAIKAEVPMGFHLCYGDIGHEHFVEPENSGLLVDMANALVARMPHSVGWVHMPCPRDRTDAAYYEPMSRLELGKAKLFLGLVRENDLEGTLQRIKVAQSVRESFGVAMECGMGRTPKVDLNSAFSILAEVSQPVSS